MGTIFNNQKGTLLLMSLLIVSSILATSILVGSLVLREIKFSKDLENATLSFFAGESGLEEALFQLRKQGADPIDLNGATLQLDNGASWSRTVQDQTQEFFLDLLPLDHSVSIGIYDRLVPGDAGGAGSVEIRWAAGSVMKVIYDEWDGASFIQTRTEIHNCSNKPCDPLVLQSLDTAHAYRILIQALGDDINNMKIKAFSTPAPSEGSEVTIPLPITVRSLGSFSTGRQGLEITLPVVEPWDL
ncbi:MAG: hypothetical protein G01um101418_607 [Parcubacteria group bacterium Gr01-1014_18]|nr:MAG: hypothetical protein Greene041636_102 [Parcubacteria group bacterium Greene0416_36]TSC80859.1 MAG: hypothetical protein G01um101418_607 [Parcubacteria group bacterium Gr01-1014_18]TSC99520.1 MAG: hypothetical protein Greene101420_187 [Parcubacteria group bacterium Greene1014_20]TSD07561.1 MAG: hypothetical protein Greene07142_18 [Parcubacteria group bacterium Greene0714_2]